VTIFSGCDSSANPKERSNSMRKLMTLMLGLSLALGAVSIPFSGSDEGTAPKKKGKKHEEEEEEEDEE